MDHLTDLFQLLELTRSQPQYGYALSGIKQDELSNLAEHHYLVAVIAWQLALSVRKKGATVDIQKVLEFSLVHDLGELFGGDIAMPYARSNPKARKLAKAFEAENQNYLSRFFGPQKNIYLKLSTEILDAQSDEAIIAKIADYLEVTHYRIYAGAFSDFDVKLVEPKLKKMIGKIKDSVARKELADFAGAWSKEVGRKTVLEIIYGTDSKRAPSAI